MLVLHHMNVVQLSNSLPSHQWKEHIQTVTVKGQVTIPAEVRKALGVKPNSQVSIRLQEGKVVIEPVAMTLEEAFASVKPVKSVSGDYKVIRNIAIDEHVEKVINKMRS